ncbi:glycosyltransferase [Marinilabiliaceae bacterium JC017]|nr:glycosyltransferase [Marinilabiliaceae bacterium JC017]
MCNRNPTKEKRMMLLIGWLAFAFITIQFMVSLVNLLFAERMKAPTTPTDDFISILIPARNEAQNIERLIKDVLDQPYNHFELIICDDQSEDDTPGIVRRYASNDRRIRLIQSEKLPKGWLGKNHACHLLSQHATGQYLLFLDADVRIQGNIIARCIAHCKKHHLSLLSIFPKQQMHSWGEKITVPVMNYILLSLLPLWLVRKSAFTSLAAANGQFMFFRAATYYTMDPHTRVKASKVEDIAIARLFKANHHPVSCQLGNEQVTCRMYTSGHEAVNGFSKNVTAFFGNSLVVSILFWLITTLGFLLVFASFPGELVFAFVLLYLSTRVCVSFQSKQNIVENVLFIIPQQVSLGLFIYFSFANNLKKQHQWKGRNIIC